MKRTFLTTGPASRIVRNILFWLLFTAWHMSGRNRLFPDYPALLAVLVLSFGITGYVHNFWLIPRFLVRRRYIIYILLFLALLGITSVISFYLTHMVNNLVPGLEYMGKNKDVAVPYHAFPSMLMFALLAFGKFMADAIRNQQKMEDLEKRRLESELQSLRSQVNPHFLFNALNTIYGLARRTDPDTPKAIIQLSDILRHSLYECEDAEISMDKEIRFLQQYVTFAKLRLHEKERINLQVDAAAGGKKIVPLLLIPFVENAIKHGLSQQSYHSWVDIQLRIRDNQLFFTCKNSNVRKVSPQNGVGIRGGIGLKNVKRRLDLLYPGRYKLEIAENNDQFSVDLQLEFS